MKNTAVLILLCLLFGLCAQAEEITYYTLKEDMYYHTRAECGGAEGMVPLSETAAKEFQKYICPVCGPIKQDISARSMVRGGTIVSCIPQSWLNDPEKTTQGVFADPFSCSYTGKELYARLSELLHGEKYADFIEEYRTKGRAETAVRVPDIVWENGELIMNERHFGDVYYIVFRPKNAFEDSYITHARFFEYDICMENDVLYENGGREWNDHKFKIALERTDGNAVYNDTKDGLRIGIFHEMNSYIAVITEENADKNRINSVYFSINGLSTGIQMSGYMDGKDAVYCCVLTDGEYALIQNGAQISISRENLIENADFDGTDYAVMKSGDFYGVIDTAGEFAMDAKYEGVRRSCFDHIFVASEAESYYKVIFDARKKQIIAVLDEDDFTGGDLGFSLWPEVQNASVFTLRTGQYNRIYDMNTGELISELGWAGSGSLNGRFEGPVYGMPKCLVSQIEGMRLMDLEGNFHSECYPRMIPLIWNDEKGLFLVANMENEYELGTDGHENAPGWRCGLIDQEGNLLADMNYVRADIVSAYAVRLRDADGNSQDYMID